MRFRSPEYCSLAAAKTRRAYKKCDTYRRKCNFSACKACSRSRIHRKLQGCAARIERLRIQGIGFVLSWGNLPVHSTAQNDLSAFVTAVDRLFLFLEYAGANATKLAKLPRQCRWVGKITAWMAAAQVNFVPGSDGQQIQPHVHLFVVSGSLDLDDFKSLIDSKWREYSIGRAYLARPMANYDWSAGEFADYVAKNTISFSKDERKTIPADIAENRRLDLHKRLMGPVERALKRPVCRARFGGILNWRNFRRAERRVIAAGGGKMDEAGRLHGEAELPCGVQQMLALPNCPKCKRSTDHLSKYGKTKDGVQRYRCGRCEYVLSIPTLQLYPDRRIQGMQVSWKQGLEAYRRRCEGATLNEAAKVLGVCLNTVRKVFRFFEQRRANRSPRADRSTCSKTPHAFVLAPPILRHTARQDLPLMLCDVDSSPDDAVLRDMLLSTSLRPHEAPPPRPKACPWERVIDLSEMRQGRFRPLIAAPPVMCIEWVFDPLGIVAVSPMTFGYPDIVMEVTRLLTQNHPNVALRQWETLNQQIRWWVPVIRHGDLGSVEHPRVRILRLPQYVFDRVAPRIYGPANAHGDPNMGRELVLSRQQLGPVRALRVTLGDSCPLPMSKRRVNAIQDASCSFDARSYMPGIDHGKLDAILAHLRSLAPKAVRRAVESLVA